MDYNDIDGTPLDNVIWIDGSVPAYNYLDLSGSASLQAGARAQVAAVAAYAQAMDLGRVQVVGHTDSQGEAQANLALSRRRADAVRAVLLEAGLNPGQVQASGRGAADPVADNATPAGRARNRRVHIVLAE